MSYEDYKDEWTVIENMRQRLVAKEFGKGDAAIAIAEILDGYEKVLIETRRLIRISDQISNDMKRTANTDELTSVFNRRYFLQMTERELERSERFGHALSILVIDIDQFDAVNETYGQRAGDTALKTLAAASINVLRRIDGFGRLGGEEFAALLPETDITGALILAERLRETISNMGIAVGSDSVEVTVTIGVASRIEEKTTVDTFLQKADEALNAAKREGSNRVAVATWGDSQSTNEGPEKT